MSYLHARNVVRNYVAPTVYPITHCISTPCMVELQLERYVVYTRTDLSSEEHPKPLPLTNRLEQQLLGWRVERVGG